MCSGFQWTVDGFDIRIRALERDDIPEVRGIITKCLYKLLFTAFEAIIVKNWRIQIVLSGLSVFLLNYSGYDLQYIAVFVSFQMFLLTLPNAVSFYRFFAPGITKFKKEIVNADKTYVNFWVSEVFKDGQWEKVGTAALQDADKRQKRGSQTETIIFLRNVSVSPTWRCKKIGTMMLKHALSHAISMKYNTIVLHITEEQPEAMSMYKKNGFEIVDKINATCFSLLSGVHVYVMARKLP
uniref:uncharacterized protein LOC120330071 n=1 Tax=Styela clava TaxID=7725 RepID=UPI00193A8884|nr:uncharacterized protein LOC120330071 [Styela clava]